MTDLHPLVEAGRILVVPGVYDVLSARIARQTGFHTAVLTGYGVAAAHLGRPDVGLFTQTEILDVARRILSNVDIGLVVDGDTGFGGPLNVQRMVRELLTMGARGLILEDQKWPKRCGHMDGKSVIEPEEHAEKICAAVEARGRNMLFITARTDALATHGIDEAIRRAHIYREAGADIIFVEGPRTVEELKRIGAEIPGPLAVNLIEGGQTPICSLEEFSEMGFLSVGFVLSGLYAATHVLQRTYSTIRSQGCTAGLADQMVDFTGFYELIDADAHLQMSAK